MFNIIKNVINTKKEEKRLSTEQSSYESLFNSNEYDTYTKRNNVTKISNKKVVRKTLTANEIITKYQKEAEAGMKSFNPGKLYKTDQLNAEGYIEEHSSYIVAASNATFAVLRLVKFPDAVRPIITTDYLFDILSENTKKFIIEHEMGHFIYHESILLNGYDNSVRVDEMEMEADEHAYNMLGKDIAIAALQEMKNMVEFLNVHPPEAAEELGRRIAYIEKLK